MKLARTHRCVNKRCCTLRGVLLMTMVIMGVTAIVAQMRQEPTSHLSPPRDPSTALDDPTHQHLCFVSFHFLLPLTLHKQLYISTWLRDVRVQYVLVAVCTSVLSFVLLSTHSHWLEAPVPDRAHRTLTFQQHCKHGWSAARATEAEVGR